MEKYRIVFMGTPIFSVAILKALLKMVDQIEIVAIVSQPDRKSGRKQVEQYSPVKKFALQEGIVIFQPEKISSIYHELRLLNLDAIITCAYGQFIPDRILQIPKLKALNIHASLLPKLRGGAPIHKAIIYGEHETGITLMEMIKKMDGGAIYVQEKIMISPIDTATTLHDKLMQISANVIEKYLIAVLEGILPPVVQDEKLVTFAYNITREEEKVNWLMPKQQVYDQIRGLYAWPIAYTMIENVRYKIHECELQNEALTDKESDYVNGTIVSLSLNGIKVKVEDGYVLLTKLQREGKRVQDGKKFFLNPTAEIKIGKIFL